jgi:hypothetical protein
MQKQRVIVKAKTGDVTLDCIVIKGVSSEKPAWKETNILVDRV